MVAPEPAAAPPTDPLDDPGAGVWVVPGGAGPVGGFCADPVGGGAVAEPPGAVQEAPLVPPDAVESSGTEAACTAAASVAAACATAA